MKTYFVDSFTNEMFKGNPAAVCITEKDLSDKAMQAIATEIGFSETAFIRHVSAHSYTIRFFSPKMEIPICGHATLAASRIIFDNSTLNRISFTNVNGVELLTEKAGNKIKMQFPVYDTEDVEVPQELLHALGIPEIVNKRYSPQNKIIMLVISDTKTLGGLRPDFPALVRSHDGINGVLVTARSGDGDTDFHYRYFWPWAGTNEDPATGGVHTFLTKYWAERLNKKTFNAFQSSARTGTMNTEINGDKVFIYGEAVTVLEGELNFKASK